MRLALISLVLVLTGCVGLPRSDEVPEIPATPSELLFTGEEPCASLQTSYDEAQRDERRALENVSGSWSSSDVAAVITLGLSDLEISTNIWRVSAARGDKAALIQEMLRRACPTVSRTPPPGFIAGSAG